MATDKISITGTVIRCDECMLCIAYINSENGQSEVLEIQNDLTKEFKIGDVVTYTMIVSIERGR